MFNPLDLSQLTSFIPMIDKVKELFNLTVLLATQLVNVFMKLLLWIWDIFLSIFGPVLQFTIDFIHLILSYISS